MTHFCDRNSGQIIVDPPPDRRKMEGVGARLGRSSSRYGTTTVFTGPVRKWKKDWVPIAPSSSSSSSSSNNNSNNQNHNHLQQPSYSSSSLSLSNGGPINGSSVSHLRLFKWTPLSQSNNKENSNNQNHNSNGGNIDDGSPSKDLSKEEAVFEPPPRKKFKYIPIAVLEEQKRQVEDEENADDEAKLAEADEITEEQASKSDGHGEKPDINDVPMDENEATEEDQTAPGRQDLNESLDLSLGLTSHEGEHDSDSKNE